MTHLMDALIAKYTDDELDELVHEAKSHEASTINNTGPEAQVGYLVEFHGGEEAARKALLSDGS